MKGEEEVKKHGLAMQHIESLRRRARFASTEQRVYKVVKDVLRMNANNSATLVETPYVDEYLARNLFKYGHELFSERSLNLLLKHYYKYAQHGMLWRTVAIKVIESKNPSISEKLYAAHVEWRRSIKNSVAGSKFLPLLWPYFDSSKPYSLLQTTITQETFRSLVGLYFRADRIDKLARMLVIDYGLNVESCLHLLAGTVNKSAEQTARLYLNMNKLLEPKMCCFTFAPETLAPLFFPIMVAPSDALSDRMDAIVGIKHLNSEKAALESNVIAMLWSTAKSGSTSAEEIIAAAVENFVVVKSRARNLAVVQKLKTQVNTVFSILKDLGMSNIDKVEYMASIHLLEETGRASLKAATKFL